MQHDTQTQRLIGYSPVYAPASPPTGYIERPPAPEPSTHLTLTSALCWCVGTLALGLFLGSALNDALVGGVNVRAVQAERDLALGALERTNTTLDDARSALECIPR